MIYRDQITELLPLEKSTFFIERLTQYEAWWNDPDVTRYIQHGIFPKSKRELVDYLSVNDNNTNQIVWAILDIEQASDVNDVTWIGNVSLQNIDYRNRSAEVAIIIGERSAWGKNHCTRVLKMVLDHARTKLGLHRVWAGTAEANVGFQRSASKAGMRHEGCEFGAMWLDGKHMDIMKYSKVWNDG